jgi:fructokinase
MQNKVVCFGEMLLDCFPDKVIPGGAPMNVALHLLQLGLEVKMISKVGEDEHGKLLLDFVQSFGLDTSLIQKDPQFPSGIVKVDNSDIENIKYEIVSPSSWDFIQTTTENLAAVKSADAFIYGSLGIRNTASWECLQSLLLQTQALKIFDINIRPPFYDFDKINWILEKTDILKINEDELVLVSQALKMSAEPEEFCRIMSKTYPLKMICITLGAKGAMIYKDEIITNHPGYNVKVEDTVGSGDAFLSGFISCYLQNKAISEILDFACSLGALVATKKGGTPKYNLKELDSLTLKS